jgi:hypothetical protein
MRLPGSDRWLTRFGWFSGSVSGVLCQALPVDQSTYHYRSKRTGQAVLMKRIREIAETR